MKILSAYKSDVGRNERRKNEDYIWVDEQTGLYIVADGMGGQEAGEIASELASNTIGDSLKNELDKTADPAAAEAIEQMMMTAVEAANKIVVKTARAADQRRKMGATVVIAMLQSPNAYISHAGDARAYLARGATIMQLTRDDSWIAELTAEGLVSKEEAKGHIYEHIVTKAIGQEGELIPSFTEVTLTPGDWLLLCSDGLWNMVEDEDILTILQQAKDDPQRAVERLVVAANDAGGKDNISIVAIKAVASD